jgi:orotate phosphoribosyltransferase
VRGGLPALEPPRPLSPSEAEELWKRSGALLEGHFLYTSGRHGAHYLEKFRLLERPDWTAALVATWLERLPALARAEAVIGPTLGGTLLAYELARQVGGRALVAERGSPGEPRTLRRGFRLDPGTSVAVVDDVVTTGGSLLEVVALAESRRAELVGVAVLADRTGGALAGALNHPLTATLSLDLPSYAAEECPLCAQGVPIEEPRGSGGSARPA